MTGNLLLPPSIVPVDGPVLFLAGPIQGAADWQSRAIDFIRTGAPSLHIASPRRATFREDGFDFGAQVDWETHYLHRAAQNGAIMFWLERELRHYCDRAYAQTTRFELGEWLAAHFRNEASLVIGADEGFSGSRYIRHRLSQRGVTIHSTLEATCETAASRALRYEVPSE